MWLICDMHADSHIPSVTPPYAQHMMSMWWACDKHVSTHQFILIKQGYQRLWDDLIKSVQETPYLSFYSLCQLHLGHQLHILTLHNVWEARHQHMSDLLDRGKLVVTYVQWAAQKHVTKGLHWPLERMYWGISPEAEGYITNTSPRVYAIYFISSYHGNNVLLEVLGLKKHGFHGNSIMSDYRFI